MNILLHLLKKDFRHLRLWVALTLATWSLLLLHPFLAAGVFNRNILMLLLVNGAGWMMTLLTLARLIHLDPFVGSDQFLSVRPVSRGMLIGSKFLFAVLALILPLFCIRVLHVALLALDLSWTDYLLLIPGLLIHLTATFLLLLLPSVFTRKTASVVLVLVAVVVLAFFALVLFGVLFSRVSFGGRNAWVQPELKYLVISRYYVVVIIFIGCAAWAAAGFAITRRWVQPALAAVGFFVLSFAVGHYWQLNFVNVLHEKGPTVPAAEQPDMSALKLVLTRKINGGGIGEENGVRIDTLAVPCQVENLPKPWFARQETFCSSARFENGTVLESRPIPSAYWGRNDPLEVAAIEMLGLSSASNRNEIGVQCINVFRAPAEDMERAKAVSPLVSIDGEEIFTVARPKVLHILPLQPGASAANRHARYTIRQVSRYPGRVTLKIAVETAQVPLRGEVASGLQLGDNNTLFLVANPTTKAFYPTSGGGSAHSEGLGIYNLSEKNFSVETPTPVADEAQLRLYIVTSEFAEQVRLPFRLAGKDLPSRLTGKDTP